MLRPVCLEELDALIDAFWPVALDLTRSTYPTYTDGVKTRVDFAETIRRAHQADWGEVLVHIRDGVVNGLLVTDEADDAYVSLHVCLTHAHQPECLAETLAYLCAKHPGKTLWLGFAPENTEMLAFAEAMGFRMLDTRSTGTSPLIPGIRKSWSCPSCLSPAGTTRPSVRFGRMRTCTGTRIASARRWNSGRCLSQRTDAVRWPAWTRA